MLRLEYVGMTHRGRIRSVNQDALVCAGECLPRIGGGGGSGATVRGNSGLEKPLFFGVFDGLGGEQCGEVASYMAAQTAQSWRPRADRDALNHLCAEMNRRICEFTERNALRTCGTTAAMAVLHDGRMVGCNLGDSRIYLKRKGEMTQLSRDHVLPLYPGPKPPLSQFLGIPETEVLLSPAWIDCGLCDGDQVLFCTDGLVDMLPPEKVSGILAEEKPTEEKAEKLFWNAMDAGGRDNLSLILLYLEGT